MSFLRNSRRAGFRALGLTTLLVSAGMLADAQIAYVANQDSNSVSVIDTATNTVVDTILVGIHPWRLAITPDNTRVYVTNNGSNSVSVINTGSHGVYPTIPVGNSPSWIAMTPDGRYAYVSDTRGMLTPTVPQASVSVIDTAANAVVTTIPMGRADTTSRLDGTNGLAITPNGRYVFVGTRDARGEGASEIMVDTATNSIVSSTLLGWDGSLTMFVSPDGTRLWEGGEDTGSGELRIIDIAGITGVSDSPFAAASFFPSTSFSANQVVFSPDGSRAYIAQFDLEHAFVYLSVVDTSTLNIVGQLIDEALQSRSLGVAITPDGTRVYVTRGRTDTVVVLDTSTNHLLTTIHVGSFPVGIAITHPGHTPPSTTATLRGAAGNNGWYAGPVTVTLTTAAGSNPVSATYYSVDGGAYQGYGAPFSISTNMVHQLLFYSIDTAGNQETPHGQAIKIDQAPPVISGMPAATCTLWPVSHKMVQVATVIAADATSGLAPDSFVLTGTSNQPSDPTNPDVVIVPNGAGGYIVQLRAERLGNAGDRIYTLRSTATDGAGNLATTTTTCTVPHDQR